jgi:hypothetical protein
MHGTWTFPTQYLRNRAAAEQLPDAVNALARPDARARRTWTISACTRGVQA